jgi:hypothetical protein
MSSIIIDDYPQARWIIVSTEAKGLGDGLTYINLLYGSSNPMRNVFVMHPSEVSGYPRHVFPPLLEGRRLARPCFVLF